MATSPATLVADLVEELVSCLADAFHSLDVPYRQIRMGDVPAFGGDLVFGDPVLDFRAVNARPAFPARKEDVHFIGDLRHEVVDVDVPVGREPSHRRTPAREQARSEEHTSELQSQSNLVCRLL